MIQCYEASSCSCVAFPDSETLVTGSHDSKVRLWRLSHRDQTNMSLLYILSGHRQCVLCVAASRAWSLVVSGSEDGCAMLWELNRAQYVRAIEHGSPVNLVTINESTVRTQFTLSVWFTDERRFRAILQHVHAKNYAYIPLMHIISLLWI